MMIDWEFSSPPYLLAKTHNKVPLALKELIDGCGGGGGSRTPAEPGPIPDPATATFRLQGAGYDEVVTYTNGPNLVFCRQNGSTPAIWVRMAVDIAAGGETDRHIDLDICDLQNGGLFTPKEPVGGVCTGGQTWAIWLHEGQGATFTNTVQSRPCELQVERDGRNLTGAFRCRGMIDRDGGPQRLNVLGGSFTCTYP